jgi:hypothetical protein
MYFRMRIDGMPYTMTWPDWPPELKATNSSRLPVGT